MWGFFMSKNLGVKKFYRDTGSGGISFATYNTCKTNSESGRQVTVE
jgi:hypothetical protein